MASELYSRKPGCFQIMDRTWIDGAPYVCLLQEGRRQAINVRWDEFKRDYEPHAAPDAYGDSPVGQWMPARYLGYDGGTALCVSEQVREADPRVSVRVLMGVGDGETITRTAVQRDAWTTSFAKWVADGRPD